MKNFVVPAVLILAFSALVFLATFSPFSPTGYAVASGDIHQLCSQKDTLFRVSGEQNAHAELFKNNVASYQYGWSV
ncbi:MAG: hypothetical protein AABX86_02945, partial [Nanoarchaeota archaeon]